MIIPLLVVIIMVYCGTILTPPPKKEQISACVNGANAIVPIPVPAQLKPDAKLRRLSKYSWVAATLGMYNRLNPVPAYL